MEMFRAFIENAYSERYFHRFFGNTVSTYVWKIRAFDVTRIFEVDLSGPNARNSIKLEFLRATIRDVGANIYSLSSKPIG